MKRIFLFSIAIFLCINVFAHKKSGQYDNETKEYKEQVKMMVKYLEDTFTFIGDPENSPQEKDIIFRESYLKVFQDENVQIEDDLDPNRRMSINKDVQAYLKDIDFFFKDIRFSITVESIEPKTNDENNTYFLVTTMRTMNGHSISGDTISERRKRYMEINLDQFKKELKIASIYTTKPNKNEELRNWWNKMPLAWKCYFGEQIFIFDTIEFRDLKHIFLDSIVICSDINNVIVEKTIAVDMKSVYSTLSEFSKKTSVDISYNNTIHSLEPLAEMSNITSLDCSNTDIFDISPIRNLNKISNVNISNTQIDDISCLKYNNIMVFRADKTPLTDISTIAYFNQLTTLSLSGNAITDITPLNNCERLVNLDISETSITSLDSVTLSPSIHYINMSNTEISDLTPIENLVELQGLNINNTLVSDLTPLSNMHKLNEIQCNNTEIGDITPLINISNLVRIYCDNTNIDSEKAAAFLKENSKVMVIFETATLKTWWEGLPIYWKKAFTKQTNIDIDPSSEELHSLIQVKSLEVDAAIQDATPLSRLTSLEKLSIANSKIIDIEPFRGLLNLKILDMRNTKVKDLKPLGELGNLQEINIENTLISDLSPLNNLNNLLIVKAENCNLDNNTVFNLKVAQPKVTVIYQTSSLEIWWNTLDNNWREIFKSYVNVDSQPKAEQLQQIANLTEINVDSRTSITSLEPLSQLPFLKTLIIKDNQLTDLSPLAGKRLLEELNVSGNAIDNIIPLSDVTTMKSLSLENSLVTDISAVENMTKLKVLNIAGTSVKNIKALGNCKQLEELNIANTPVKSLSPILNTQTLKHLKAFNTKIKKNNVDSFKSLHPDINIVYY